MKFNTLTLNKSFVVFIFSYNFSGGVRTEINTSRSISGGIASNIYIYISIPKLLIIYINIFKKQARSKIEYYKVMTYFL